MPEQEAAARGARDGLGVGAALALLVALAVPSPVRAACDPPTGQAPAVELVTTEGSLCIDLLPDEAPEAVANFLALVDGGDYEGAILHRSVPGFVIQGGGFRYDPVTGFETIGAGTSPGDVRDGGSASNTRATVAMARDSQTGIASQNQFFVSLADNSFLDGQGFVVFGSVRDDSMAVADAIAGLPILNGWAWLPPPLGVVLRELPLRSDVLDAPAGTYGCVDPMDMAFIGSTESGFEFAADNLPISVSPACKGAGIGSTCTEPDQVVQEAAVDTLWVNPMTDVLEVPGGFGNVTQMTCDEIAASDAGLALIEDAASAELVEIQQAIRLPEPGALWSAGALGLPLALLVRRRRAGGGHGPGQVARAASP